MRTISLRQFRDSIPDLTEPVTVQRRDKAGNFQVLGEWRPMSAGAEAIRYGTEKLTRAIKEMPSAAVRQASRDAILRKINTRSK